MAHTANHASALFNAALPWKISGVVVKFPPVGEATPLADAVIGWPVNVPLKTDKPTGFAVGVTVLLPMTISGTRFSESVFAFASIFRVVERVLSIECNRSLTCDSETPMDKERLMWKSLLTTNGGENCG